VIEEMMSTTRRRLTVPVASAPIVRGTIATAAAAVILGAALNGVNGDALRVLAVFVSLGALTVALPTNRWALGALALVGTWWIAVLAIKYLPDMFNPAPPVSEAVGGAAFFGTSYRGAQIAAVVSVAIPAVIAIALPAIEMLRGGTGRTGPAMAGARSLPRPRRAITGMWIGAAILAFTLVPDLRGSLRDAGGAVPYSWDESNLTAWQGLVQMGLVPMKDFFYPYGYQWLYTDGNFGPMVAWFAQVAMLAVAAWSLWRLTAGSVWRVLACLVALLLVSYWGADTWRYLPALLVPLSYAGLEPGTRNRLGYEHLWFFAACLLAALVEPDLLAYGLVGAVLVFVGRIVSERLPLAPRRIAMAVAIDAVPVVAAVGLTLFIWIATGTAAGNLRFYAGFSAVSSSSAPNERLYGPLGLMVLHPTAYSLYAAIPALLATAGFLCVWFSREHGSTVGTLLLGGSGASLVMLLKHLVRPVGDLMLIIPLIVLLWAVILVWRASSVARAIACGLAVAALYTMLDETGGLKFSQVVTTSVASPVHAVRSVQVAFDQRARVAAAEARISPARFAGWPDLVIAGYYTGTVKTRPLPPFAIIGDSAETYVLLGQRPPWETDLYDAAPVSEQDAMLQALARRHPQYVIWRRDVYIDGVPYDVRDPLIFSWMIRNYVPVQHFPTVDILGRRPSGGPPVTAFWTRELGTTVQLGYIPSFSSAASAPRCGGGPGCVPYVLMRGTRRVPMLRVKLSGGGASYTVVFNSRAGVAGYPIRADRLWFWPLLRGPAKVVSLTRGYTAHIVRLRSGDNLY